MCGKRAMWNIDVYGRSPILDHTKSRLGGMLTVAAGLLAFVWFVAYIIAFNGFGLGVTVKSRTEEYPAAVFRPRLRCMAQNGCYYSPMWPLCANPGVAGSAFVTDTTVIRNAEARRCWWTDQYTAFPNACFYYDHNPANFMYIYWRRIHESPYGVELSYDMIESLESPERNTKPVTTMEIGLHYGVVDMQITIREDTATQWKKVTHYTMHADSLDPTAVEGTTPCLLKLVEFPIDCRRVPDHPNCRAPLNATDYYRLLIRPMPLVNYEVVEHPTPWAAIFGVVGGVLFLTLKVFYCVVRCFEKRCKHKAGFKGHPDPTHNTYKIRDPIPELQDEAARSIAMYTGYSKGGSASASSALPMASPMGKAGPSVTLSPKPSRYGMAGPSKMGMPI